MCLGSPLPSLQTIYPDEEHDDADAYEDVGSDMATAPYAIVKRPASPLGIAPTTAMMMPTTARMLLVRRFMPIPRTHVRHCQRARRASPCGGL